jgi:hypothetical protein
MKVTETRHPNENWETHFAASNAIVKSRSTAFTSDSRKKIFNPTVSPTLGLQECVGNRTDTRGVIG